MAAPRIQLVLSESNIDVANNRSTVTGTLYYYGNGETYNANTPCSITIGGNTKNFTYNIQKYTNGVIGSHSVTFTHNSNGSLNVSYSASVSASDFYGPTRTSGTYTCKTIARATTPVLSPNKTIKYGQNLTITLNPAVSTFNHKLYYSIGNGWQSMTAGYATSPFYWTVPKSLANQVTDSPGRSITIRAETYNGTTYVGAKETAVVVVASDDMKPSVSITLSDPTGIKDRYGGYFVRGQSKIKATLSETLSYNAAIKLREIVIDGIKYTNVTTATSADPVTKLNEPVTARVTDKRDMVGTATATVYMLDWYQPKLINPKVQRCTAGGTLDDTGNYLRIDYAIDVAPLNNKNTKRIKISTKKEGDQYWSSPTTVTPAGYKYQDYAVVPASSNYVYDVKIELSDDFTNSEELSTSVIKSIGTAFALVNWRNTGKGMAIGKVSEKDEFEVAIPADFKKSLVAGAVDLSMTSTEYNELINLINSI